MNNKHYNPQSWHNCGASTREYVNGFIELLKNALSNNLTGIYLHGSLAMDSYFPPKSDIDIIVVVNEKLKPSFAKSLNFYIAKYSNTRENIGDLEFSVITKETAKNIPPKIPYEMHYSRGQYEKILNDEIVYDNEQYDNDLFSHLMYVKKRGICLFGQAVNEVFGDVEWKMFIASILEDLDYILNNENIYKSPIYGVLNICRVLKLITSEEREIQSKYEGGKWGIDNLPDEYKPLIEEALDIYCSNSAVNKEDKTGGLIWNKEELDRLCDYVKRKTVLIRPYAQFLP